ncbi:MAG: hypothetical protein CMH54_02175 [Myxococcales bacterium]|nr:hypothetical protein [Myxococcales bacterium]
MGAADVIPGVSGGTMALITGIYRKLVFSIHCVGLGLLKSLLSGAYWKGIWSILAGRVAMDDIDQLRARPAGIDRDVQITAFLILVGVGIVVAGLTMVKILPGLLLDYPTYTKGFFFGLVLASALIPWSMIRTKHPRQLIAFAAVAILTFLLMGIRLDTSSMAKGQIYVQWNGPEESFQLSAEKTRFAAAPPTETDKRYEKLGVFFRPATDMKIERGQRTAIPVLAVRAGVDSNMEASTLVNVRGESHLTVEQPTPLVGGKDTPLWYIFVVGVIAISAMILPGISGSFLLLMLGQYEYILFRVHSLVYEKNTDSLPVILIFMAGLGIGILAFSRFLNWLLDRAHDMTMAGLTGLMIGSLRKIWPFRTTDGVVDTAVLPSEFTNQVAITGTWFLLGLAVIGALSFFSRKAKNNL